jgi:WD40 repeat protein
MSRFAEEWCERLQTVKPLRSSMKLKRAVAVIGLTICPVACSNDSPVAPTTSKPQLPPRAPIGVVVSDPHPAANLSGSGAAQNVVYVSARPGTFQDAQLVEIRNSTRSEPLHTAGVLGSGFDPIAVEGEAADELILTVSSVSGVKSVFSMTVPSHAPPVVVRTDPLNSQVDVALDSRMHVVFSEPLDPATVNASSVALNAGNATLAGTQIVTAGCCEIVLIPDGRLASETEYSILVSTAVRDLDGSALEQRWIATFQTIAAQPINAQIVFQRYSDHQIYVMAADGSSQTRLTNTAINFSPAWSPDGKRIAFARNFPGRENHGFGITDIYTMAADGSDVQRRTVNGNFYSLAWSPDGKTLAISDGMVYYGSIYLISASGEVKSPSFLVSDATAPAWSPDGKHIAYVHLSGDDGYNQVYVVNADGTDPRAITEMDPGSIVGVAWSPDGARLAVSKCLDGSCGIYTMDSGGGPFTRITDGGGITNGAWSPDGQMIVLTINDRVASVRATGGVVRELFEGASPAWHP